MFVLNLKIVTTKILYLVLIDFNANKTRRLCILMFNI